MSSNIQEITNDQISCSRYPEMQHKGFETAKMYENLPLQDRINMIAQTFCCNSGRIITTPCSGKWRGTSDIFIVFENGVSLCIGNYRTPESKTVKVQNECVNYALARYNSEIVNEKMERAAAALLKREAEDNAIAAEKGLNPYKFLNVELCNGSDPALGGHLGWYYVTLAIDNKIIAFIESGLCSDIERGVVSERINKEKNYYIAGAVKDNDVDFVFNNVGFSTKDLLYKIQLSDGALNRANKRLRELNSKTVINSLFELIQQHPELPIYPILNNSSDLNYCEVWKFGSCCIAEVFFDELSEPHPVIRVKGNVDDKLTLFWAIAERKYDSSDSAYKKAQEEIRHIWKPAILLYIGSSNNSILH